MLPTRSLLPFSPHYAFHVVREMTISGVVYQPGDPVPKGAFDERRLRQLYEQRRIAPHAPDFLFNGAEAAERLREADAAASQSAPDGHGGEGGADAQPEPAPAPEAPRARGRAKSAA